MNPAPVITRFAPSPTGLLHLGHAYSAAFAATLARRSGGRFLLRIEDIDRGRCRPEFEAAIFEDLDWLGLDWPRPVRRQNDHMADYRDALCRLDAMGLIYPCFLSRRELGEALSAPHLAAGAGPSVFDTDRLMTAAERKRRMDAGDAYALRLRMRRAVAQAGDISWHDRDAGWQKAEPEVFGDIVLARKDVPASYHLAVTVDDALQEVSLVTRGADLFEATHIHRLLQALLGLPAPEYRHHRLIVDANGRRLAKRDRALTLRALRDTGHRPYDVLARIGLADGGGIDS